MYRRLTTLCKVELVQDGAGRVLRLLGCGSVLQRGSVPDHVGNVFLVMHITLHAPMTTYPKMRNAKPSTWNQNPSVPPRDTGSGAK